MFQVISMNTVSFEVEYQRNCAYDYLRVYDSSAGGPKFRVSTEKSITSILMASEPMKCILMVDRPWTFTQNVDLCWIKNSSVLEIFYLKYYFVQLRFQKNKNYYLF